MGVSVAVHLTLPEVALSTDPALAAIEARVRHVNMNQSKLADFLGISCSRNRQFSLAGKCQLLYTHTVSLAEYRGATVATHRFGGAWTERKLAALGDYLVQFQVIFTKNPAAQKLRTVYVDAFAGTGDRDALPDNTTASLFGYSDETREFQQGSARVALELKNKFHHYVFIDRKVRHIEALRDLVRREVPNAAPLCEFVHDDANSWLQAWCSSQDWKSQRAVVFLDPYGMSVAWETIEAIARTRAVDLWILFPFAIGANRMMPSDELPDKDWGMSLTNVFGTVDWMKRFYERKSNADLFGPQPDSISKVVAPGGILAFFVERLKTVFPHVVDEPMILYNSNNSPMYALCFAAGNEKGGKTAIKIAAHLARTR